jgi:hypothetical protein
MSSKERDRKADRLWNLFADDLIERMEKGEEAITEAGEVVRVKPKSPTLAVIAKFLKDNDVGPTGNADETGKSKLDRLLAQAEKELSDGDHPFN